MQPIELVAESPEQPPRDSLRNFACPGYDQCLNLAVARQWAGFSCRVCQSRNDEREDWCLVQTRDVIRVRRLLAAAMRRKWPELGQGGFWSEVAPERLLMEARKPRLGGMGPGDGGEA